MSAVRNKGLGRGLDALIEDAGIVLRPMDEIAEEGVSRSPEGILLIDIDQIKPNAKQPRKDFNEEKIEELAGSIRVHGLLQPIMVRKAARGYEIVAGERRWRAARAAGLKEIPCIVRALTEEQNLLIAIIENLQREGLNAIEEAEAFQSMISSFSLTQDEVAKSVGKSRPYVTNALRLLKLPEAVQAMVASGQLSGGHARAIAGIKDQKKQLAAAQMAVDEGWSVRQAEVFAGERPAGAPGKRKKALPRRKLREVLDVEEELKAILGTKVTVNNGPRGGKIVIDYYSREELERLLELLQALK